LSSLFEAFDAFVEVEDFEFVEEAIVYGLKWNPDVEGVILADCVTLVLLIRVAFDMIGATFELFMLNFFVLIDDSCGDDVSAKSGSSSDDFDDFEGNVYVLYKDV
jgi:hypothetical protein